MRLSPYFVLWLCISTSPRLFAWVDFLLNCGHLIVISCCFGSKRIEENIPCYLTGLHFDLLDRYWYYSKRTTLVSYSSGHKNQS